MTTFDLEDPRQEASRPEVEAALLACVRRHLDAGAAPNVAVEYSPGEAAEVTIRVIFPDPVPGGTSAEVKAQRGSVVAAASTGSQQQREAMVDELMSLTGAWRVTVVYEIADTNTRVIHAPPKSAPTVPVTVRLPWDQARLLDLLVDAGIGNTRTAALDWCIRRVAQQDADLLKELRPIARQRRSLRWKYSL